jgi:hypothetical protein
MNGITEGNQKKKKKKKKNKNKDKNKKKNKNKNKKKRKKKEKMGKEEKEQGREGRRTEMRRLTRVDGIVAGCRGTHSLQGAHVAVVCAFVYACLRAERESVCVCVWMSACLSVFEWICV